MSVYQVIWRESPEPGIEPITVFVESTSRQEAAWKVGRSLDPEESGYFVDSVRMDPDQVTPEIREAVARWEEEYGDQ